jgi:hypothetical protein
LTKTIRNDWFGRAANGETCSFLEALRDQIYKFSFGIGHAGVFGIGRVLKEQVDKEERTIFGRANLFAFYNEPANRAVQFYELQLQSYRKAVNSWTIVGLRNRVVKDIRKMIGKMIWDAREEAKYLEEKQSARDIRTEKRASLRK